MNFFLFPVIYISATTCKEYQTFETPETSILKQRFSWHLLGLLLSPGLGDNFRRLERVDLQQGAAGVKVLGNRIIRVGKDP